MSSVMHDLPRRHRITVEHFYRMAEAGLFASDERVELVNGEVIDVRPMGSRHASAVAQLGALLAAALGERAMVRQQLPLRLGDDSEPLPDITVVKPVADYYRNEHPAAADALLVAEIGDSTLQYDLDVKVGMYARSNVPEVWVVDLNAGRLHVHRSPSNGHYAVDETRDLARLELAAVAGVEVDLSPLLL